MSFSNEQFWPSSDSFNRDVGGRGSGSSNDLEQARRLQINQSSATLSRAVNVKLVVKVSRRNTLSLLLSSQKTLSLNFSLGSIEERFRSGEQAKREQEQEETKTKTKTKIERMDGTVTTFGPAIDLSPAGFVPINQSILWFRAKWADGPVDGRTDERTDGEVISSDNHASSFVRRTTPTGGGGMRARGKENRLPFPCSANDCRHGPELSILGSRARQTNHHSGSECLSVCLCSCPCSCLNLTWSIEGQASRIYLSSLRRIVRFGLAQWSSA